MTARALRLLVPLLLGLAGPAAAQQVAPPATVFVNPSLGGVEVAGYSLMMAATGGANRTINAGAAEIGPDGGPLRPMTAGVPVRIASVSKLAVALALHRLADAGRIKLDDEASTHLGWTLRNPAHPQVPVTIRQMMRHESSLSDAGGYTFALGERLQDRLGADSWSKAAPGTAFDYANLNQAILGQLIEQVTGQRFDIAVQQLVFGPLGIPACFNWSRCPAGFAERGAVLYRKAPSSEGPWDPGGPWVAQVDARRPADCHVRVAEGQACNLDAYVPGTNGALFSPQGGMRIAVSDLVGLGLALLDSSDFLKPETRASLFRPVAVKPGGDGEETDTRLMQYWSEGGFHCFSGSGAAGGDQPLSPQPLKGCGHLGNAYGLLSGLVIDPEAGTAVAYAITGTSAPPPPGRVSRFSAPEEDILGRAKDWLGARGAGPSALTPAPSR
jgi:CubicO group peptidase (beta-lactamase class C family)